MRKFVTLKTTKGEILEGTIFLKLAQKSAFAPCIEIREKVYFKHVKKTKSLKESSPKSESNQKKHQREKRCLLCKVCLIKKTKQRSWKLQKTGQTRSLSYFAKNFP
jgi:hypothetical protein